MDEKTQCTLAEALHHADALGYGLPAEGGILEVALFRDEISDADLRRPVRIHTTPETMTVTVERVGPLELRSFETLRAKRT